MDNATPSSLPVVVLAITAAASLVGIPTTPLFLYLFRRRLQRAETASADALAVKNSAEARKLELEHLLSATKTIIEQDNLIHEMSLQRTRDELALVRAGWDKIDLAGTIKTREATIGLLEERLALARSKGFVD